jgi:hypothetical protein
MAQEEGKIKEIVISTWLQRKHCKVARPFLSR